PGNELFENSTAMPRFSVVHQVKVATSLEGVDLRRTAVSEYPIPLPDEKEGENGVKVVEFSPNLVVLRVKTSGFGLLLASETHYPGWKAWVDDQPATIHRVDLALRGIVVPDGEHRVRMEFRPTILWLSLGISLLTAALLAWMGLR